MKDRNVRAKLGIGQTKWCKGGWIEFSMYSVGNKPRQRIAMILVDDDSPREGPLMTITVNFPEVEPHPGHVWIKDWSENEGVLAALIKADIGVVTGKTYATGFVNAHELRLSDIAYVQAQKAIDLMAKYNDVDDEQEARQ